MKTYLYAICSIIFLAVSPAKIQAQTTASVCVGATTTLTGATTGGTWGSSNTSIATVGLLTGVVLGVSAGTATIIYETSLVIYFISVTVNPLPSLSSTLTPHADCDSTVFNYTPESAVPGTIFSWYRPYIPGIYSASGSGTGNPMEQLVNTTYVPVTISYIFTLSANGCTDTNYVTVVVNPTPRLSSTLTPPAICDTFIYLPTSFTPGATFTWNRPYVAGIFPPTDFGVDSVHEYLHNSTIAPITVFYEYRLGLGACQNLYYEPVRVIVDPCDLSANEIANSVSSLKVYPNPSHGSFTLEMLENTGSASIVISDILGKVIETRNVKGNTGLKEIFNMDNLPSGSYIIKVVADGQTYRDKIVVW